MDNVKITANFEINGRVKDTRLDKYGEPLNYTKETVSFYSEKEKRTKSITYKAFATKPCVHSINLPDSAYNYMLETPVNDFTKNNWKKMSIRHKIAEHLKLIQIDLNASDFTFIIHED